MRNRTAEVAEGIRKKAEASLPVAAHHVLSWAMHRQWASPSRVPLAPTTVRRYSTRRSREPRGANGAARRRHKYPPPPLEPPPPPRCQAGPLAIVNGNQDAPKKVGAEVPCPSNALEGKGPRRRPQRRSGRRLEEVAKAVMGGYCRLQMPFKPALAVRGTIPRYILGALEAPSSLPFPMHPCPPPPPPVGAESFNEAGPSLPPLPPLRHTRPAPAGRRPWPGSARSGR